jgi:MFS family permease
MINNKENNSFLFLFLMVFLPFSLGFILSCLFRTMNTVLISSLENTVHFSTTQLGFITSVYFLAQGMFQIPLGILLDKFGPKNVQIILLLIASIGLILCGVSYRSWEMVLANVLVGIGMSGGLMSALKIIVQWFPANKLATLNGLMMTSGGLGIIIAATPTSILVQHLGWTGIHLFFAGITLLIAVFILVLVPSTDKHLSTKSTSLICHIKEVFGIYKTLFFWRVAPLIFSILGTFMAFHSLWIQSWMSEVANFSQFQINENLSIVGVGMTLSLLGSGYIYNMANKASISLLNILVFFAVLFFIDEWILMTKFHILTGIVWFMYGFLSHKFNLCFTIFSNHYPKTHSARANGALNITIFFSAFFSQYLFGVIVSHWSANSANHYPTIAYQVAFGTLFLIQIICFIWYLTAPFIINFFAKLYYSIPIFLRSF